MIDTPRREVITHGKEKATAPTREKRQVQEAPVRRGLLSARETEILNARARGLLTKEIAHELKIDDVTVRVVLRRVRAKLF